jgi:transposase
LCCQTRFCPPPIRYRRQDKPKETPGSDHDRHRSPQDTHTAAAVEDSTGQLLDELTIAGTDAGHECLRAWAHGLSEGEELRFALEDCRHVNGRLERFLLAHSEIILRVGTRLMANTRKSARTYGKSDSIDALAIARAALREPTCARHPRPQAARAEAPGRPPGGPGLRAHRC